MKFYFERVISIVSKPVSNTHVLCFERFWCSYSRNENTIRIWLLKKIPFILFLSPSSNCYSERKFAGDLDRLIYPTSWIWNGPRRSWLFLFTLLLFPHVYNISRKKIISTLKYIRRLAVYGFENVPVKLFRWSFENLIKKTQTRKKSTKMAVLGFILFFSIFFFHSVVRIGT